MMNSLNKFQSSLKTLFPMGQICFLEMMKGWMEGGGWRVAHNVRNAASKKKALGSWKHGEGWGSWGANLSMDPARSLFLRTSPIISHYR